MAADLWRRLLAALECPCAVCGGTGKVLSDAWKVWHERAGELIRVAQAAHKATTLQQQPAASRNGVPQAAGGPGGPTGPPAGPGPPFGPGGPGGAGGTVPAQVPQALRQTTPQGVPQIAPAAARAAAPPVGRPVAAAGGSPALDPSGGGPAGEGHGGAPAVVAAIDRAIDDHVRARPPGPEQVACEACEGCGRALTAAGVGLTEFLARHGLVWAGPGVNGRGGEPVQPGDGPFPTPPRGQL
nr:hypothetical protein GCM10010200_089420 [Actinomadura rugatobispora]